jgi:integrase
MSDLADYLAHLRLAGFRPSTLKARQQMLSAMAESLAPRRLLEATADDLAAYLARPLAQESRRAYRAHFRSFYGWALEDGRIEVNPARKLPGVRVARGLPRPVSDEDLSTALAVADARMRCWLLLMALAGLRCIEVANLHPPDVIRARDGSGSLYLRECKGGGTATMPAHPAILQALDEMPMRDGEWWTCRPNYVSREVSVFLHAAGVNATAHQLRHFAGTAWYRASGYDLLATSRLLRHASVATTQIYAALDETRPAEVVGLVNVSFGRRPAMHAVDR